MNLHTFNPLLDRRWNGLVARHPRASVFHERGWLQALALTYGYEPYVMTSASPNEPLSDGVVLCRVSSWMTGTRLVSLPFSDHCDPLVTDPGDTREVLDSLRHDVDHTHRHYVELRPLSDGCFMKSGLSLSQLYWFHELDLEPSSERIFRCLHKNSFQRKIRRAERERLSYEVGSSDRLVDEFYWLLLLTRRRHHLLPQPRLWFKNLVQCMGDKLQIRLARKNGVPIAATLTLRHGSTVVYKYGCSDARFHSLGGIPFLLWRMVEESKGAGVARIDFGRSEMDNEGLLTFKDRFGTTRKLLNYYRYTNAKSQSTRLDRCLQNLWGLFDGMPDVALSTASRVLYKHLG